ncbi:HAD family hydrolase, partial [Vibrio vulnificus]|nr:HAD family hydrolase [Vibrio vulnificus]
LDSNQLKIEAMKNALEDSLSNQKLINKCLDYFGANFGKSRFHHVAHFLDNILGIKEDRDSLEKNILGKYSVLCKSLYLEANLTPGFLDFLNGCEGKCFIASGSEQKELREVFSKRKLEKLFDGIYGSPAMKKEIIKKIISNNNFDYKSVIMIGDAISDLEAAIDNNIDFLAYVEYSNVPSELRRLANSKGFEVINHWKDLYD